MWTRVRERLTTQSGAPDPRQRQYAVLVLVAVVVGTAIGWLLDLHTPALVAGLTAVLALVASGGQSLRSDLYRFAWFTPALVLTMTVGPLLANVPVLAGAVVAVVVFGTGMLPALGEHYHVGGQTFAAATLVSTTTGIGADQPVLVLLGSSVAGALFALVLRVVIGLSDPTRATRVAVARTLLARGPGVVESAAAAWRADGSSTWLGQVLAGAARFRAARETLLAQAQQSDRIEAERLRQIVAEADQVAAELARSVRARACTGLPAAARRDPAQAVVARGGRQDLPDAVQGINQGLDRIRAAVVRRVDTPLPPPAPGARRERLLGAVRAHLSFRSSLFRHALRCTLAVAFGMVIVALLRDPSASSLLLALYVVLQPAARDSMTGALERTGGAVLGVTALAIVITLLPGAFLLVPLVIAGMLLNMPRLRTDYQVLLSCLIVITVVDQAMRLERPLVNVGISFAANTAVGAAIALIVGYVSYLVLPSSILPDVRGAVRSTVWAVSELLRSVRAAGQGVDLPTALQAAHVLALRRTQDLLGMPALLDGTGEETDDDRATRDAAIALDALRQDVATLAFRPEAEQAVAVPALRAVDDLLGGKPTAKIPDVPEGSAPATELLASSLVENALHARQAIDRTFGYDNPWKSYTISFVRTERLHIR
ncbi:FUSC family protein [Saccharopolyspora thermophila]|uniref:FUSC family protein n=1 Tax=Saccharopolyspora thermophila TaxID=89367 RepID=UPI001E6011DD|nr:FUSC family protein [Saccharopolyspora subtropica]